MKPTIQETMTRVEKVLGVSPNDDCSFYVSYDWTRENGSQHDPLVAVNVQFRLVDDNRAVYEMEVTFESPYCLCRLSPREAKQVTDLHMKAALLAHNVENVVRGLSWDMDEVHACHTERREG